jgi:hypothetical protein
MMGLPKKALQRLERSFAHDESERLVAAGVPIPEFVVPDEEDWLNQFSPEPDPSARRSSGQSRRSSGSSPAASASPSGIGSTAGALDAIAADGEQGRAAWLEIAPAAPPHGEDFTLAADTSVDGARPTREASAFDASGAEVPPDLDRFASMEDRSRDILGAPPADLPAAPGPIRWVSIRGEAARPERLWLRSDVIAAASIFLIVVATLLGTTAFYFLSQARRRAEAAAALTVDPVAATEAVRENGPGAVPAGEPGNVPLRPTPAAEPVLTAKGVADAAAGTGPPAETGPRAATSPSTVPPPTAAARLAPLFRPPPASQPVAAQLTAAPRATATTLPPAGETPAVTRSPAPPIERELPAGSGTAQVSPSPSASPSPSSLFSPPSPLADSRAETRADTPPPAPAPAQTRPEGSPAAPAAAIVAAATSGTPVTAAGRGTTPAAIETAGAGETRAIHLVLERYQTAFNDLNASIAKSVWPSLDEKKLGKAFDSLAQQKVTFDGCQIDVSGVEAVASCHGHARYVPKVGNRAERLEPRTWAFRLQNTSEGWTIAGVQTR